MYGQISRKRVGGRAYQTYAGQVRLVRLSPHDSRVKGWSRKSAARRSVVLLLLSALFFISVCAGAFRYVFASDIFDVQETAVAAGEAALTDSETAVAAGQDKVLAGADLIVRHNGQAGAEVNKPYSDTMGSGTRGSSEAAQPGDIVVLGEEQEMNTPLVAIDAGHGGEDDGCSRSGVLEKEVNLEIAVRLAEKLQALGYDTMLIREDNETKLSLSERVDKAEEAGADIYVSIHQNAYEEEESSIAGIETWYCEMSEDSRRLAQLVHKGAVEMTGAKDRELRETEELYVIRETSMPSCLIETGFLSNSAEREAITSPEYQDKLAAGMAQGIHSYFNPKTMYLTFDDGPSEENTSAILDILAERNIKATFFVIGENVRRYPEVARRIVEEGHTMGIHCDNHDYGKIYESVDSYLADFQAAYDTVYEVTGVEVQLFRFPGGSINAYNTEVYEDIIDAMTERGFIYFDWNASLEDASKNTTPEQLVQNGINSTLGRRKVVMLAHDIVYNTTLCLEQLIDNLSEYKMEPLTPDVTPIQFKRP